MNATAPRSTFVTVVGWIFVVLSGLASLIGIMQNVMLWTVMRPVLKATQGNAASHGMPAGFSWMSQHIEVWFGGVLLVFLVTFTASLGLLLRRNWGRVTFMVIMGLGIAWNVAVLPLQCSMMSRMSGEGAPEGFRAMTTAIMLFTAIFSIGFAVLFGWIIKKLASPSIRAEFVPGSPRGDRLG